MESGFYELNNENIMKKEDVDLEEMFENEIGKEWHRTYPHIYTKWLEDKLTEQLVKNCSIPLVMVSCFI